MSITIAYSPEYLRWEGSHASPQRAHLAVEHITARAAHEGVDVELLVPEFHDGIRPELTRVHDKRFVKRVLNGHSHEWSGKSLMQGETAAIMFEGTRVLVDAIIADEFAPKVYFNPQGAKHHAGYADSSGFCVFNDMAYAAHRFTEAGLKVAYIDWDVHHGDGVEDLTRNNPRVLTASIHQFGIFPGTGLKSSKSKKVYNFPLLRGDGDVEFLEAMQDAVDIVEEFGPDVLLLACGADGLAGDPLGQLEYTLDGIHDAAHLVGDLASRLGIPVLVGGAGGYQPFSMTPLAWYETVWTIYEELKAAGTLEVVEYSEQEFDWSQHSGSVVRLEGHNVPLGEDHDVSEDEADSIMEALADIPMSQWEDVLTVREYDLVQARITPLLMDAASKN